jgi:DNA-binding CsgD family transcriptional regulator
MGTLDIVATRLRIDSTMELFAHSSSTVYGRDDELLRVHESLARTTEQGRGCVMLIGGEAGIGKTTLLHDVSRLAVERGMVVINASATALDRSRPFGPLVDVLGDHLLPAPTLLGDQRRSPLQTGADDRIRMIDSITDVLEQWSVDKPVLLAVDDLQWSDPETIAALARVHRLSEGRSLAMALAYRRGHRNEDLRTFVAAMAVAGAIEVNLSPLSPLAVNDLVLSLTGGRPDAQFTMLLDGAGGSPFLLRELVGSLLQQGRVEVSAGTARVTGSTRHPVVAEIRQVIIDRMTNLGADVTQLIKVASALGSTFSVADLAAVLGQPVAEILPRIDTAMYAGIFVERDDQLGFRHDLVRDALESTIPASALAALHLDIARTLAAVGAPAIRVATHYSLGARPGDRTAVRWLRSAAADVSAQSPASASKLLDRAMQLLPVTDPERDLVTGELVDALFWSGEVTEAAQLAERALARPVPETLEWQLRATLARAYALLARPRDAVEQSARIPFDAPDGAWTLALSSVFRLFALDLHGALLVAERVENSDDSMAVTLSFAVRSWIESIRGYYGRAVEHADQAVAVADRSPGGAAHRAIPHLFRGLALESAGRSAEAIMTLQHGMDLADQLGTPWATPFYHYALTLPPRNAARWDDALAECQAGQRYAELHDISLAASWAYGMTGTIHVLRLDLDQAQHDLDRGDAYMQRGGTQFGSDVLAHGRALLLEARGEPAAAQELLKLGCQIATELEADATRLMLAPDLVRLSLLVGDPDTARVAAVGLSRPIPGDDRPEIDATARRCMALVDEDVSLIDEAVEVHERCLRPVEVALDLEAAAFILARRGQRAEAQRSLERCVAMCGDLQLAAVIERSTRGLAGLGVDIKRAPASRRALSGWASLTSTEKRIARLVAVGGNNRDVAEALFISRRTVESHLYRIFAKLDITNRTALAAIALREPTD